MSKHPSGEGVARIDLAAAEWLVKRDRGFTAAEQDEFLQWLSADPRHGEWLVRHQLTWTEFNQLAQWRPEHSVEPNPDLLARPPAPRRQMLPLALAIAAGLTVVAALWWPGRTTIGAARLAAPSVAAAYERRTLDDGSTVELNRGAAIVVNYSESERRLTLVGGEAHFTVAENARRPFIVHARGVDVRAVGTAFNVRLDPGSVEVLVTHGKVSVDSTPAALTSATSAMPGKPIVSAGHRAVVSLGSAAPFEVREVSPADIARALAWQPQLLDFSSTPLRDVIAEFNRRNRVQLVLATPDLAALPIVASIRSDNVDGLVRMLHEAAGLRGEYRGASQIVLHPAK